MAGKAWTRAIALAALPALLLPQAALAAPAPSASSASSDIVVTGTRSKLSSWRQAETNHIIMLSDGSEAELVRLTRNLERLHFLISSLMGRGAGEDDTVKIRITLIGDAAQFDQMDLHNRRWQQGPYNELFTIGRYYDPRTDGAVMASIGADQRVLVEHTMVNRESVAAVLMSMATGLQKQSDPPGVQAQMRGDMMAAIGSIAANSGMRSRGDTDVTFGEKAMTISQESLLYAGYAQHFLLTYFPAAYPRWYLDGFGQIFATMAVKGDNVLEFGRAPDGASAVMQNFGPYPIKDVLDDEYLTEKPSKTGWTPIHAWMLTHFLFFSDKYRPELRKYLAARADGTDAATAARIFGDQRQLAQDLRSYFYNRKPFLQITYDGSKIEQPIVRRLREGEAAFVKGRLELGARVEVPPAPRADTPPNEAADMTRKREEALRQRDKWLAGLRRDAARWPNELGPQLLLAEAECRSGNPNECLAAATRAAAIAPADPRPMMWKGYAMVHQAASQPPELRATTLASARDLIIRANHVDHDAVGPLMAYYASFADLGETPSASAVDGLQKAMQEVPAAPETRLLLAAALAKGGNYDVARPVIMPVAAGAYDTPEKPAAKALLAQLDSSTKAQPSAPPTPAGKNGAGAAPSTGGEPPVHP